MLHINIEVMEVSVFASNKSCLFNLLIFIMNNYENKENKIFSISATVCLFELFNNLSSSPRVSFPFFTLCPLALLFLDSFHLSLSPNHPLNLLTSLSIPLFPFQPVNHSHCNLQSITALKNGLKMVVATLKMRD